MGGADIVAYRDGREHEGRRLQGPGPYGRGA